MLDKKPRHIVRNSIAIAISLVFFVIAGWLVLNRQYAMDQVTVWAYQPTASVQSVEDNIKLTSKGKFYFHTAHPQIADAESFNHSCPRREVGNPVLGCYSMQRIYIYDIEDPKLEGIKEVTAAHEMLHAVWDRMDQKERDRVGGLLEAAYNELASGELKDRMAYYSRTQPGEFHNELHSIIGTEMATLSPELETYYAQYFVDRSVIIALHDQYDKVFKDLQSQADTLFAELGQLRGDIESRSAQYNSDVRQLSADIQAFNERANNNGFESIGQFNRERAALVSRSNQLDQDRAAINDEISLYNEKYKQYQATASQIESLNKSIDSINALEPAPSL
jgi:hypothetical protein